MSVILDASQIEPDMASESTSDNHPAHHASQSRPSRENSIPSTLLKRDRSTSATPKIERTMSMTDSFILEHLKHAGVQSPPSECESSHSGSTRKDKEAFAPISNWAHLSYLKNQRNQLRTELKVHQVAGAEAKHSISSLRRLALRMAVNISVKERQIANTARNLASSRKKNYLSTRDTEKRIAELTKSLEEEEFRNKDILDCLEKASMLTLQLSDPNPEVSNRVQPGLASPPSTPPNRIVHVSHNPIATPKTPTRPASSLWDNHGWDFTPESSTADIRTQDGRLIQAKRESDRALAACRSRIADLRAECARSNDAASLLTATQTDLESEVQNHQTRIANLERSRATIEDQLRQTKMQLGESAKSEEVLRADLDVKMKEIEALESTSKDRQETIRALEEERTSLQGKVQDYDGRLQKLETYTSGLEEELHALHRKLAEAEQREVELRAQLAENETSREAMAQQLKQGRENMATLEKSITFFQSQITEGSKKVQVSSGVISSLRNDLKESEDLKSHTEAALTIAQGSLTELESRLRSADEANHDLRTDLDSVMLARRELEEELQTVKAHLASEKGQKQKLQSDLDALRESRDTLENDLRETKSKIQKLEGADTVTRKELQSLSDAKATIEGNLKEAREHSAKLRKELDESNDKLTFAQAHTSELSSELQEAERIRTALQVQLQGAEQTRNILEAQLEDSHKARSETVTRLNTLVGLKGNLEQERDTNRSRLANMESKANGLQSQLSHLKEELRESQQARGDLEERLNKAHSEVQSLNAEKSSLNEQLSANLKTQSAAQEHLGSLQNEAANLNSRIAELQARADAGDVSKADVERSLDESMKSLDKLQNELTSTQTRLSTVDDEGKTLRSKLSSLETDWALAQEAKKEVDQKLQEAVEARSKRESDFESLNSQLNTVTSERDELLARLSATEKDLNNLQESKANLEERLAKETKSNMDLDSELRSTRSKLHMFEVENTTLQTRLTDNISELEALQRQHAELDERLNSVSKGKATLEEEVNAVRGLHQESEGSAANLQKQITELDQEANKLRSAKAEVEQQLVQMTKSNEDVAKELDDARSRLSAFETDNSALHTQLSDARNELDNVRKDKSIVEERLATATGSSDEVVKDLEAVRSQLREQEVQSAVMVSRISEADKELEDLKQTNEELGASEKDLLHRLEVAEKELQVVKTANNRLETFLEKVEQDMLKAEAAFADSEQRLDEFVAESEAKISAATAAKLKYKRRLTARNKEIEILIDENSELHHHVSDQSRELDSLVQGKNKLLVEVQAKEKAIQELGWTHEERLQNERKNKDDQLEELRQIKLRSESDYEAQLQKRDSAMSNLKREQQNKLESELQAKDARLNELQKDKDESAASLAAVEAELWELRKNQEEFETLVETLNKKIRHLEALEASTRPQEPVKSATPTLSDAKSHHDDMEAGPSTPSQPKRTITLNGTPDRSSVQPDVPVPSTELPEGQDSWQREVDRVRLLRDETANQLKGMKKVTNDLKKSLRDSEAQLHDLEKSGKTKRTPTVLRKRSYYAPARDTETLSPSRPATAGLLHQHNTSYQHNSLYLDNDETLDSPRPMTADPARPMTAGPSSSPRRWSSLPRPKSSYRPATSKTYGRLSTGLQNVDEHGMMAERPKTSLGGSVRRSEGGSEKKRWSSLRRLFHKH